MKPEISTDTANKHSGNNQSPTVPAPFSEKEEWRHLFVLKIISTIWTN